MIQINATLLIVAAFRAMGLSDEEIYLAGEALATKKGGWDID